jgi:hypothetical protein
MTLARKEFETWATYREPVIRDHRPFDRRPQGRLIRALREEHGDDAGDDYRASYIAVWFPSEGMSHRAE